MTTAVDGGSIPPISTTGYCHTLLTTSVAGCRIVVSDVELLAYDRADVP